MGLRVLACFLATFVANGLARFGYVVLIPLLILSGKLSENQSIQLGIAVMVGYIFGSAALSFLQKYLSLESIAKISFFSHCPKLLCLLFLMTCPLLGVGLGVF
ncbi:nitrite extrusion protein [Helicobacter bizzozeronii CCUG 35545]|nr:nitrite extrusion protein [Helicobacter bizzozeronii CCUG 35545]